jgi:hypothetical protein
MYAKPMAIDYSYARLGTFCKQGSQEVPAEGHHSDRSSSNPLPLSHVLTFLCQNFSSKERNSYLDICTRCQGHHSTRNV